MLEPYIKTQWRDTKTKQTIPAGEYFVMGDNRDNSLDSRAIGPVGKQLIIGKALLAYWPMDVLGLAPDADPLGVGLLIYLAGSVVAGIGILVASWVILTRRRRSRWWTLLAWFAGGLGMLVIYLWLRPTRPAPTAAPA